MKKLLIVDDHPVVLEGLAHVFSSEGYEVETAVSRSRALDIYNSDFAPDVVVVDLTIDKDADGLDLIKMFRTRRKRVPVVVYTMHEELWNIASLADSGIEGIVLKGESLGCLVEAVRAVGKGVVFRSPGFSKRFRQMKEASSILSRRDIDILNMVGNGESSADIAEKMCISLKAVEYHRSRIMDKLDSKNMAQTICNAVRLGILSCVAASVPLIVQAEDDTSRPVAVDLGLSVKWADRNLGASEPLGEGGYYAFGETVEKERYHWDTYSLCENSSMFSQADIGDESICGTGYDAARVLLGDDWRLPTVEEVEELLESCTATTCEADGGNPAYVRLSAAGGGSIDFPLTGYRNNDKHQYAGRQSVLHTGSFYVEAGSEDGFVYHLNSPFNLAVVAGSDPMVIEGSSHLGLQIRPVSDSAGDVEQQTTARDVVTGIYSVDGRLMHSDSGSLSPGIYIFRYSDSTTRRRMIGR